jgi:hypothetical protein
VVAVGVVVGVAQNLKRKRSLPPIPAAAKASVSGIKIRIFQAKA